MLVAGDSPVADFHSLVANSKCLNAIPEMKLGSSQDWEADSTSLVAERNVIGGTSMRRCLIEALCLVYDTQSQVQVQVQVEP